MNSKDRAKLRKLAHNLSPSINIGKEGVTKNLINEIDVALENKELIKVKGLQNSDIDAKSLINELAAELKAEPIQRVGKVMVLYRRSKKDGIEHIEF